MVLYQVYEKKSRIFPRILFHQLQHLAQLLADEGIVFPSVGPQAVGAVFDTLLRVAEIATALVSQGIQGAVAEQAAEAFRVGPGVAGKVFTFPVLKKIVMGHEICSFRCNGRKIVLYS